MFNRILVALMLSTLVMTPVQAVDNPLEGDIEAQVPVAAPRVYRAELWEGAQNVGSGTKKLGLGTVNTLYNTKKGAEAFLKAAGAVYHTAVALPSYVYADAETKDKHFDMAGKYASGAVSSAGKGLKNIPEAFTNFKDGVVELGTGIGTIAKTSYAAVKDAVESETAQKVKTAVASAASYVGSKVSSAFSWLASKVTNVVGKAVSVNFDNVSF